MVIQYDGRATGCVNGSGKGLVGSIRLGECLHRRTRGMPRDVPVQVRLPPQGPNTRQEAVGS